MQNELYVENNVLNLKEFLSLQDEKEVSKVIYWNWAEETGDTEDEIYENDLIDSEFMGKKLQMAISVTGKQAMAIDNNYYMVTLDANGGKIGSSESVQKQVTCGESYGELPTTTREGYTLMGWNGKNLFELKDTPDFIHGTAIYDVNKDENSVTIGGNKTFELIEYYLPTLKANTTYSISGYAEFINLNETYLRISKDRDALNNNHFILDMTFLQNKEFNSTFTTGNEVENNLALLLYGNWAREHEVEGARVKISNLMIEECGTATEYEPYYLSPSTKVTQTKNHTLTAIWRKNEN